jgi:hypothetical protein
MSRDRLGGLAFYDGPKDVGPQELERIVQGMLWVGEKVLVPSYVRPSGRLPEEERKFIGRRLAEFAEAGYLTRWNVEGLPGRLGGGSWWPLRSSELTLPLEEYGEVQSRVAEGVAKQRTELARGLGHRPGEMMSGVAEIVALRETLWTLGVARYFSADLLVSTSARSESILAPLRLLRQADMVRGPATETLLGMRGISGLSLLSSSDIKRLRRKGGSVRRAVDLIAREAEESEPFVDGELDELVRELTERHYTTLLGKEVESLRRSSRLSRIGGGVLTVAGIVFPPLSAAGFAQPILEWNPHGRDQRRLLLFLTRLQRKAAKRTRKQPGRGR